MRRIAAVSRAGGDGPDRQQRIGMTLLEFCSSESSSLWRYEFLAAGNVRPRRKVPEDAHS